METAGAVEPAQSGRNIGRLFVVGRILLAAVMVPVWLAMVATAVFWDSPGRLWLAVTGLASAACLIALEATRIAFFRHTFRRRDPLGMFVQLVGAALSVGAFSLRLGWDIQ